MSITPIGSGPAMLGISTSTWQTSGCPETRVSVRPPAPSGGAPHPGRCSRWGQEPGELAVVGLWVLVPRLNVTGILHLYEGDEVRLGGT